MNNDALSVSPTDRYFEDFVVGSAHECGTVTVTQDDIIAFARRYDPQFFHTDPQAAKKTMYGGLIASGWHTAAMAMRLLVDHYLPKTTNLGSPGVDELRWTKPVRPGDLLSLRVTVLEANRSRSKPDRGILRSFVEVMNQKHEVVMTMKATTFVLCRDSRKVS